jgi:hypothetical protein
MTCHECHWPCVAKDRLMETLERGHKRRHCFDDVVAEDPISALKHTESPGIIVNAAGSLDDEREMLLLTCEIALAFFNTPVLLVIRPSVFTQEPSLPLNVIVYITTEPPTRLYEILDLILSGPGNGSLPTSTLHRL